MNNTEVAEVQAKVFNQYISNIQKLIGEGNVTQVILTRQNFEHIEQLVEEIIKQRKIEKANKALWDIVDVFTSTTKNENNRCICKVCNGDEEKHEDNCSFTFIRQLLVEIIKGNK